MGRRFRALLGIATTWGVAFSVFSTGIVAGGLALGVIPGSLFGPRQIITVAIQNFLSGAIAGGLFGLLFARAERSRTLETVSMRRVALWGFIGVAIPTALVAFTASALYQMPLTVVPAGILVSGLMGSMMSMATIKVARRAPALDDGAGSDLNFLPPRDQRT